MADPYLVDPEEHRGANTGLLSRLFVLARRRRDDDITGPRPLPRLAAVLDRDAEQ